MSASRVRIALVGCFAFALPAAAQDKSVLRVPSAGADLPLGATTSTSIFRAEALRSDALSLAASRLALARSKDPQVLDHARRAIVNREATTAALRPAGTPAGGRVALGPVGQAAIDRLRASPDEAGFNRAYVAEQARASARTLALYDGFYRSGDTDQGRRFAYEALPWIESERARAVALRDLYGT